MKFLLCADLHLDAKTESNFTQDQAKLRRRELLETFRGIVEKAAVHGAEVVLIAGDLFDEKRVGTKSREFVLGEIAAHPQITFLYLTGNHDAGFGEMPYPENLKRFDAPSGWTSYRFGSVVFTGTEHPEDPVLYDQLDCREEDFNVVLMHGQIHSSGTEPEENTVCLKLLKNKNIDLLALGHLHSYTSGVLDKRGVYRYPGCPDARGMDECGEKGVLLFEVTEDRILHETFLPCSSRIFHRVRVPMDGLLTYPEIEEAVLSATGEFPVHDAVRVELVGNRIPEARMDVEHLETVLRRKFWYGRVKDETHLALNPAEYIGDVSLKGEFIRLVMASRMKNEEKERVILTGLRALRGEEVDG